MDYERLGENTISADDMNMCWNSPKEHSIPQAMVSSTTEYPQERIDLVHTVPELNSVSGLNKVLEPI